MDVVAARADAQAIADMHPFAVLNGAAWRLRGPITSLPIVIRLAETPMIGREVELDKTILEAMNVRVKTPAEVREELGLVKHG